MIAFKHDAMKIIAEALAEALKPPDNLPPSKWAPVNLRVPDGPHAGQAFDLSATPYLIEPLDFLGPESPVNEIAVMKSAQTGFTTMLIALIGYIVDRAPCRVLVIQPTSDAAAEFNREKLDPAIKASPALKRKVALQTSRSSEGSTTYSKRFPGGSITLAISTSAADLRSKTVRVLLRDEIDQYPDDLDGQGDPLEISDGRLISFLASGDWRKADISTPTIKGASKIERRYEAGDQRRWHVPCPSCGEEFVFEFGPNFRFEQTFPHKAFYVAPCCGGIVEPHMKLDMVRKGRWIAGAARPGAFPSYHCDAMISPFVPWDSIAKAYVDAGDDPQRQKTFANLWIGRPYEMRGDAPDYVRLLERREEGLPRGHIPPRGLILTAAADIQMRGIYYEVVAWAPNRESWILDADYIDGSTESPKGEAFEALRTRVLDRDWPDAFGRTRKVDALGVDSGYRAPIVYAWTRAHQQLHPLTGFDRVLALKGLDGWGRPSIGAPTLVDINLAGGKVRKGAKVFGVGSWPLKSEFYTDLAKLGLRSGKDADPEGYVHLPDWIDEVYCRQITSEYLAEETFRGRTRRFWKQRASERDNHFLDCRVYNIAIANYLGLLRLTAEDWAALVTKRGAPQSDVLPLFAAAANSVEASAPSPSATTPSAARADEDDPDGLYAMLDALGKANEGQ